MEIKFSRALKKTKEKRLKTATVRLELGVDVIKNNIQKSRFRWLGHVMRMREERVHKNATQNRGKTTKRKTQNQMNIPN